MSDPTKPQEEAFEEVSSRLIEGLENCRSVVKGYQAILGANLESTAPGELGPEHKIDGFATSSGDQTG